MSTPDTAADLAEKVLAECRKYGLETMVDGNPDELFDVLLRHLRNNNAAVLGVKDATIDQLTDQNAEWRKLVDGALFLRQYGERPPGAPLDRPSAETWRRWDIEAEAMLRAAQDADALRAEMTNNTGKP